MEKDPIVALYTQDQRIDVEYPSMRREAAGKIIRQVNTASDGEGLGDLLAAGRDRGGRRHPRAGDLFREHRTGFRMEGLRLRHPTRFERAAGGARL